MSGRSEKDEDAETYVEEPRVDGTNHEVASFLRCLDFGNVLEEPTVLGRREVGTVCKFASERCQRKYEPRDQPHLKGKPVKRRTPSSPSTAPPSGVVNLNSSARVLRSRTTAALRASGQATVVKNG